MQVDLSLLFEKQKELDLYIIKNHPSATYQNTFSRRLLALLVELGEFANSTRCFKFWSNKGSESKERVLDEYADGLHFLLSLGIAINNSNPVFEINKNKLSLVEAILVAYSKANDFYLHQDEKHYHSAFKAYLNILNQLQVDFDEIKEAYLKKLEVNYQRQDNNY